MRDGRPLPREILYAKAPIRSSIDGPSPPDGAFHLVAQRWLDFKRKEWADETYRKAEFVGLWCKSRAQAKNGVFTIASSC
jgi:hypothetical protein